MKKGLFVLLLALMAVLGACSSEDNAGSGEKDVSKAAEQSSAKKSKDESGIEVDKGLFSVEVTLPASFFEGEDIDKAIADAKADGVGEAVKNSDGSVTYKMSKAQHKKMMKELEASLQESIDEMKSGKDFASIKDVTYNKSFTEFTMIVDKNAYENSMDGFASFGLGIAGAYYQLFNGASGDDYKVTINVKDQASGETFDEIVFPDDMQEGQ